MRAPSVRKLLTLCANAGDTETGGILVGRYGAELNMALVDGISSAPADSVRHAHSFVRGVAGLQTWLNILWRKGTYYLGEWHYHPGGTPCPSQQDLRQMVAIAQDPSYHCPEPVLLLIGHADVGRYCACAYVVHSSTQLVALGPSVHGPGSEG